MYFLFAINPLFDRQSGPHGLTPSLSSRSLRKSTTDFKRNVPPPWKPICYKEKHFHRAKLIRLLNYTYISPLFSDYTCRTPVKIYLCLINGYVAICQELDLADKNQQHFQKEPEISSACPRQAVSRSSPFYPTYTLDVVHSSNFAALWFPPRIPPALLAFHSSAHCATWKRTINWTMVEKCSNFFFSFLSSNLCNETFHLLGGQERLHQTPCILVNNHRKQSTDHICGPSD